MANPTQEKTQLWKIERGYRIRGYIGTPIYAEETITCIIILIYYLRIKVAQNLFPFHF